MTADVRWQQRSSNFCRALKQLDGFFEPPELNDREQQGLIKAFEYCFELGWNTHGICCVARAMPPCWGRGTPSEKPFAWDCSAMVKPGC